MQKWFVKWARLCDQCSIAFPRLPFKLYCRYLAITVFALVFNALLLFAHADVANVIVFAVLGTP